jgi:hypothetical protein
VGFTSHAACYRKSTQFRALTRALEQAKDMHRLHGTSVDSMSRQFALLGFPVLAILASLLGTYADSQSASAASPCVQLSHRGVSYVVRTVDLPAYLVRLSWKDPQQQPYAGFDHLPRRIEGGPIVFAMNARMYEEDFW